MKEGFSPPQPPRRDKSHLILCIRGAGQSRGQSPNADAQQLPLSLKAERGCCYGNGEGARRQHLEPVPFPARGSWIWREAKLKGGGRERETEAQQNACMLEEGPSQNESTVGYRRAGTPNWQPAVARLGGINLIFPL